MKFKITSGPNVQFYLVTAFFVYMSYANWSIWPIIGWIGFCLALIPLCIWLHQWNQKENEQMLKDFPHDPYIQKKYGGQCSKH